MAEGGRHLGARLRMQARTRSTIEGEYMRLYQILVPTFGIDKLVVPEGLNR